MKSLRTLTLTEISEDDGALAQAGPLLVERGNAGEAPAAIASLANTLGGWLLVDGELDLAAALAAIDPPPAAAAAPRRGGGTVVRVASSQDTPHHTVDGAVLVRDHESAAPAAAPTLLALVERGTQGRAAARERQYATPLVEEAMRTPERLPGDAPILDPDSFGPDEPLEFIVRATPVTVTPELSAAALTEGAARLAAAQAIPLLVDPDAVAHRVATEVEGRVHGVYCTAERGGAPIFADLVIAGAGVVAARLAERRRRDATVTPEALVDEVLLPLLRSVGGALDGLRASGRALVDLEVRGLADLAVEWTQDVVDVVRLDELADEERLVLAGELVLPAAPGDLQALAERWTRGLARAAGLPAWEPEG